MGTTANPLYRTMKLIASTSAFRSWCGIDSTLSEQEQYDAAKERVHIHMAPKDATRPFALVEWGENRTYRREGQGYILNKDVVVSFIDDFPAETAENIETFDENQTAVVVDMGQLSDTDDHIDFESMEWQGYTIVQLNQSQDVIWSAWNCTGDNWGVSDV